jgi:hypothetical protein
MDLPSLGRWTGNAYCGSFVGPATIRFLPEGCTLKSQDMLTAELPALTRPA